jgi:hypothetical protein
VWSQVVVAQPPAAESSEPETWPAILRHFSGDFVHSDKGARSAVIRHARGPVVRSLVGNRYPRSPQPRRGAAPV